MSADMKKGEQQPDWSRFGLSAEQQQEAEKRYQQEHAEEVGEEYEHHNAEKNELFTEDQVRNILSDPWESLNTRG